MGASFVWAAVLGLVAGCAPSNPTPTAAPSARPPVAAGVAETLAGPGFCEGDGVRDRLSEKVGAIALDRDGRLYFDTGPADEGLVVRSGQDGRLSTLRPLTPRGPYRPKGVAAPAAGRLAPDGSGGVFIAAGAKVVRLDSRGALHNIAGDPAHPPRPAGQGSSGDGGSATAARFGSARAIAADQSGNLFVADQTRPSRVLIRYINLGSAPVTFFEGNPSALTVAPGAIQTIALEGGPLPGQDPVIAVSPGRLYLATSNPASVRVVNLTSAAAGLHGLFVNPGSAGRLKVALRGKVISGLAAGPSGDLYLADTQGHRVLRIPPGGGQDILAGSTGRRPVGGFNGNDRRARGALLNRPYSLVVGPDGRVHIADQENGQVRAVDSSGIIRAVPGAGAGLRWNCEKASRKAGPLAGAPAGVAVDRRGRTYFTTSLGHQVKFVSESGKVVALAGRRRPGSCTVHGVRKFDRAGFRNPAAIAAAPGGLYVADCSNTRVSFLNTSEGSVKANGVTVAARSLATVAGTGVAGFSGDGGPALKAQFGGSVGAPTPTRIRPLFEEGDIPPPEVSFGALAADRRGNLFIADPGNGRVRRVDRRGIVITVAGETAGGPAGECCRRPAALAADANDNLYVFDAATRRVWYLNLGRAAITLRGIEVPSGQARPVAGNGGAGFEGEGGPAPDAQLLSPTGLAVDGKNNLYILEVGSVLGPTHFDQVLRGVGVRKVDASGVIRTVIGPGHVGFNGDYLKPSLTSLAYPAGIAADRCGNLLVADLSSDRLRRFNLAGRCPR